MIGQGDVLLFQTNDNGEISIENGLVGMTGGFNTAVYLALFGGNADDDTTMNNKKNWWGNLVEPDPLFHYRSKTQYVLSRIIPISGNLVQIEDAVETDLQKLIDFGAVDSVDATVSLIDVRKVKISIEIIADSEKIEITFLANWKAQSEEPQL